MVPADLLVILAASALIGLALIVHRLRVELEGVARPAPPRARYRCRAPPRRPRRRQPHRSRRPARAHQETGGDRRRSRVLGGEQRRHLGRSPLQRPVDPPLLAPVGAVQDRHRQAGRAELDGIVAWLVDPRRQRRELAGAKNLSTARQPSRSSLTGSTVSFAAAPSPARRARASRRGTARTTSPTG